MPYNNQIPKRRDRINISQDDLLVNFNSIKRLVDENHVTFDIADEGKHKFVQIPDQTNSPSTIDEEGALYIKSTTETDGNSALFFKRESDGTEIQFSYGRTRDNTSFGRRAGWARLPSGLLLKWGFAFFDADDVNPTTRRVLFPSFAPVFTSVLNIQLTPSLNVNNDFNDTLSNFVSIINSSITVDRFDITVASLNTATIQNQTVFYSAIGIG